MKLAALQQIMLSTSPLLISGNGYTRYMMEAFPIVRDTSTPSLSPYKELAQVEMKELINQYALSDIPEVCLTDDYVSEELPSCSIAYYRIFGFITSACRWWFNSKQLELDLLAADKNPQIACHFLHINSPGGEAWYLDRLSETMRQLQKPVFALMEQVCASAAYYIGCHAQKIAVLTQNDQIGCIGTMASFVSFEEYYAKLGIKQIQVHADQSDLKNKKFDDLLAGKPKQYIQDMLNPLAAQFIQEVRDMRPKIKPLPDDAPVLRGETFSSAAAIDLGLVDSIMTFPEAVQTALSMAKDYDSLANNMKKALKFI
nr:MAG TPA: hypothetical protein [Caudoviricetes sp.]